jgi:hypothetical protein
VNRHTARRTRVPDDWQRTLAQVVPALRATSGNLPDVLGAMLALGDREHDVVVLDAANDAMHTFTFDHIPSLRELASCELAIFAPHN